MKIYSPLGRLKLGRLQQQQKYQKLIDIECIVAAPLLLPPADDVNDDAPVCYICLDNGPDESGQPIRRDCSCRGTDSGFAHLSCLAKFAEQESPCLSLFDCLCKPHELTEAYHLPED